MANPAAPKLSLEEAKAAASQANAALNEPSAAQKLTAVQAECQGDIAKFFMLAIPLATEVVAPTLEKYGFEKNQGGAMAFVGELQKHNSDPEILQMANALKSKFMPAMAMPAGFPMPPAGGAPADEMPE
mmetsp:Transcript_11901/g.24515  ORF Transcript_11901/g.24515 Transcript_11901/m.24515 type:complete len:129 (-) Transcript_11901:100-486(-)